MKIGNILLSGILCMSVGCIGIFEYPSDCDDDEVIIIDDDPVDETYVNTYVSMPYAIRILIAPYASNYFSPRPYRYCDYLYPSNSVYDPYDLPCYVRADFNGDGFYDYAFLFSMEEWGYGNWYLTTKLLVVLSTPYGHVLTCDLDLGTVYAEAAVPIEEFWSISYMPAGDYSVITYVNGVEIEETIGLPNDGFYLASLDADEESMFYAIDDDLYEITWEEEKLTKRSAVSIERKHSRGKIRFEKNTEGRKRMTRKK